MNLGIGLIALGLGNSIVTQALKEEYACIDIYEKESLLTPSGCIPEDFMPK